MALKPRMKSGLADSMESWASLWEDSGWVWYTLVSEHGGAPAARRTCLDFSPQMQSALSPEGGKGLVAALSCSSRPRTCRGEARGSGLTEDCSLQPACPCDKPRAGAALTHRPRVRWNCSIPVPHVS